MSELRQFQLSLLEELARFCEAGGLRYYLCGGTLLGAVRHQGYIPWDDDIDVMMPRPDFEALCANLDHASAGHLRLLSPSTVSGYPFPYAKLSDARTVLVEESSLAFPLGVNIDVFPVDGWASTALSRSLQGGLIRALRLALDVKAVPISPERRKIKQVPLRIGKYLTALVSPGFLLRHLTRFASKHSYATSTHAGIMVAGVMERVQKDVLGEPTMLTFEGVAYPAPQHYDTWLKAVYGDYTALPPEDKQVTHHRFKAYWREIN